MKLMRSEKEIKDRIKDLRKLEDDEANHIKDLVRNDELGLLEIAIMRANTIQNERLTLEWVLDATIEETI